MRRRNSGMTSRSSLPPSDPDRNLGEQALHMDGAASLFSRSCGRCDTMMHMGPAGAYRPQADDTSAAVDIQLVTLWRLMAPADKLCRVVADCRAVAELALAGIRWRYPRAGHSEVRFQLAALRFGNEVAQATSTGVWMTSPTLDPIDVALVVARILGELGISYAVGGAIAASVHGEPRATEDLDIIADVTPKDVDRLITRLEPDFYVPTDAVRDAVSRQTSFSVIHRPSVRKVDVFVAGTAPMNRSELCRATDVTISANPSRNLCVATAEDILLQKLLRFEKGGRVSDRQWRDILGILKVQANHLDRAYVEHWAGDLGVDVLLARALKEAGLECDRT
jgi:hypothetical protein